MRQTRQPSAESAIYNGSSMPQPLSSIHIHLVFSTKDRAADINGSIRSDLHAYMATVVRNSGSLCDRVGGTEDHVHLAIRLSRSACISDLVKELKTSSSAWLKRTDHSLAGFSWQRGYAAISFGQDQLPSVLAYIDNQETHHRKTSFMDEYRAMLDECGIVYIEQYLFD